jgi:hypothetical protein
MGVRMDDRECQDAKHHKHNHNVEQTDEKRKMT